MNRLKSKVQSHSDAIQKISISEQAIHEHIEFTKIEFLKNVDHASSNFNALTDSVSTLIKRTNEKFEEDLSNDRVLFLESKISTLIRDTGG